MIRRRTEENVLPLLGRLLLVAELLTMGCGGGDGAVTPIPIADLRARAGAAVCGYLARCGSFPDEATCERGSTAGLQVYADVTTGKTIYDGQAAARCLAGYDKLACSFSGQADIPALVRTCAQVFAGTVPNGGACLDAAECVSQSCDLEGCNGKTCCAGTCQDKIVAGGSCQANGSVCVDGTYCHYQGPNSDAICTPFVASGQPCLAGDQCAAGTACLADAESTTPGMCGKPPAEGERCPVGICDSLLDVCDATSKTCVRRAAVGASCAAGPACVTYATCDATSGVCVAQPGVGDSCDGSSCLLGLACTNGICTAPTDTPACP